MSSLTLCPWLLRRTLFLKVLLTTFHVSPWFQKDEPSSRLNKVPPMGAPKAAATPAAAPADTKSRLSLRREEKSPQATKGSSSLPYLPTFYLTFYLRIHGVRAGGQVSGEASWAADLLT